MKQTKYHSLDGLLVLLLFGIFAASILSVLMTGADAYQRLTRRNQSSYTYRTVTQYIAARVHSADAQNGISATTFGGTDTLELAETIDGETYTTKVYYYDGYIRELFTSEGGEYQPEDGDRVIEAQGLSLSQDGGLLTMDITCADGSRETITLSLRSGEGVLS